jgi:hypothetical protein
MFLGHVYKTSESTGTGAELASHAQLGTSYVTYRNIIDQNPSTQTQFTQGNIDDLRYGSKSYTGSATEHGY